MSPNHDQYDDELPFLASVEPPAALVSRVRRVARMELAVTRGSRWRLVSRRLWTRMVLPAAIVFTVGGYLHWALVAASALHSR